MSTMLDWFVGVILLTGLYYRQTEAACTFPSQIRDNWYSSEKGTLNFTADTIWDYPIALTAQVTSMSFVCEENRDDRYFLRSATEFTLFSNIFYAYLCLEFTKISEYKYYYQHLTPVESSNQEYMFSTRNTPDGTYDTACTRSEPFNISTYITLVKEGAVETGFAEATCPEPFLAKFSSVIIANSAGTQSCKGTADVCTDRTLLNVTYDSTCGTNLKFSAGGQLTCLHHLTDLSTGITYLHVWNNDTTVDNSNTYRIICIAFTKADNDTVYATRSPRVCYIDQTDTTITATTSTPTGHVLQLANITETCVIVVEGEPQGLYIGLLVGGIVLFVLIVVISIVVTYKTRCRCWKVLCKGLKRCLCSECCSKTKDSIEKGKEPVTDSKKDLKDNLETIDESKPKVLEIIDVEREPEEFTTPETEAIISKPPTRVTAETRKDGKLEKDEAMFFRWCVCSTCCSKSKQSKSQSESPLPNDKKIIENSVHEAPKIVVGNAISHKENLLTAKEEPSIEELSITDTPVKSCVKVVEKPTPKFKARKPRKIKGPMIDFLFKTPTQIGPLKGFNENKGLNMDLNEVFFRMPEKMEPLYLVKTRPMSARSVFSVSSLSRIPSFVRDESFIETAPPEYIRDGSFISISAVKVKKEK